MARAGPSHSAAHPLRAKCTGKNRPSGRFWPKKTGTEVGTFQKEKPPETACFRGFFMAKADNFDTGCIFGV